MYEYEYQYYNPNKRRRYRSRKSSALKDIAQICLILLLVLLLCFMWPFSLEDIDLPDIGTGFTKSYAQTNLLNSFSLAQGYSSEEKNNFLNELHQNEEWVVTGGPSNGINEWLTFYGILAYHWDEAAAQIAEHYPGASAPVMTVSQREMFAACLLAAACGESLGGADAHGMDVPQVWGIGGDTSKISQWNSQWYALSYEQKADALRQHGTSCWCNDNWGTSCSSGDDRTYSWGYGLYQFTWGRRINLVNFCDEMGLDFTSGYGQAFYTIAEFMDVSGMTGRDKGVTLIGGYAGKYTITPTITALEKCTQGINSDNWGPMVDLVFLNHVNGNAQLSDVSAARHTNRHDLYLSSIKGKTLQEILRAYQVGGVVAVNQLLGT